MKKNKRLSKLFQLLRQEKTISLKQAAQIFGVSEMTIRRDIRQLEANNMVFLKTGKIWLSESPTSTANDNSYHVTQQKSVHYPEKSRIAIHAAKLIKPGDSVIIDIGTTTSQIAAHLPKNYPISVFCFTFNALLEILKMDFDYLSFMGGIYHKNNQLFESSETLNLLKNTRATIAFISAAGVSESLGVTCVNPEEVPIKIIAMQNALKKVLVADSSKFGIVRNSHFGEITDFDIIITDSGLSDWWKNLISKKGIRLIIA